MNRGHLSDEQFAEVLAGEMAGQGVRSHLAACAFCRREIESLRAAMAAFTELGTAWAQVRAPRLVKRPSRWALYLGLYLGGNPSWRIGVAAAATLCVMAFGFHSSFGHDHGNEPAPMSAAAPFPAVPSSAELAEDNHLMRSIDEELQYEAAPVVPASELREAARRTDGHTAGTVLN